MKKIIKGIVCAGLCTMMLFTGVDAHAASTTGSVTAADLGYGPNYKLTRVINDSWSAHRTITGYLRADSLMEVYCTVKVGFTDGATSDYDYAQITNANVCSGVNVSCRVLNSARDSGYSDPVKSGGTTSKMQIKHNEWFVKYYVKFEK